PPPRPPQSTIPQLTSLLINNAGALDPDPTGPNTLYPLVSDASVEKSDRQKLSRDHDMPGSRQSHLDYANCSSVCRERLVASHNCEMQIRQK
ncbi:hypothetical protein OQ858_10030, partial [Mycobacterium ulcerans]|nr:hypothetical protein [Mycobacterium ulcerans]MEB4047871.1 hypothetical protein [Mycobacterium ulcerans]MEB4056151.1 hypothetical protein [Mycobacterium ulcerans]MEB4105706.1 hypothetical protein [Mycobacterium ulcerans]MEB4151290.1 hypothetical protein [Mycobacterium ulcerans]